jgi:hypothetical protein
MGSCLVEEGREKEAGSIGGVQALDAPAIGRRQAAHGLEGAGGVAHQFATVV